MFQKIKQVMWNIQKKFRPSIMLRTLNSNLSNEFVSNLFLAAQNNFCELKIYLRHLNWYLALKHKQS
jgi:hypothetical protein